VLLDWGIVSVLLIIRFFGVNK
jgi:hypothetical protein